MYGQTFGINDLTAIGLLIILEALLSADNAMVLAIMVRHLKGDLQKKALLYGLGGAFILRTVMIGLAAYIIQFWWLQFIGALYLIWMPINHFIKHAKSHGDDPAKKVAKNGGFWQTVAQVELVDVAFALDSVLVGVAVVNTAKNPDKTWVVVAGGVMGVILLRFAAGFCIKLLNRYPVLDHIAYILVGWAGVKMIFATGHTFEVWWQKAKPGQPLPFHLVEMPPLVFWTGLLSIIAIGTYLAIKNGPVEGDPEIEHIAEEAEEIEHMPDAQLPEAPHAESIAEVVEEVKEEK